MKPECDTSNNLCEVCECKDTASEPLKHCYDCNLSYCPDCVDPPLAGKLGTDTFAHWFCKDCFKDLKVDILEPKPKPVAKKKRRKDRSRVAAGEAESGGKGSKKKAGRK